jgi:hypothetical protein
VISLTLEQPGNLVFMLVDVTGKTLKQWTGFYQAGDHRVRIDLSEMNPGIYYLKATSEQSTLVQKIMVN